MNTMLQRKVQSTNYYQHKTVAKIQATMNVRDRAVRKNGEEKNEVTFRNLLVNSIPLNVDIKQVILAGIMDGDKKKLPKDLDWNDVNFYKHQHEVEAMEDRDEWVKVTKIQKLSKFLRIKWRHRCLWMLVTTLRCHLHKVTNIAVANHII